MRNETHPRRGIHFLVLESIYNFLLISSLLSSRIPYSFFLFLLFRSSPTQLLACRLFFQFLQLLILHLTSDTPKSIIVHFTWPCHANKMLRRNRVATFSWPPETLQKLLPEHLKFSIDLNLLELWHPPPPMFQPLST